MSLHFSIYDKNLNQTFEVHYIDDDTNVFEELEKQKVLGWDTETTYAEGFEDNKEAGLDPYRSRLRLTQFATQDNHVYLFDHFKIPDESNQKIKYILELPCPVKCGHNTKFDVKMSRHHLGVLHMGKIFDTELGFRLTQCGQYNKGRISLAALTLEILGFSLDKELQVSDWSVWDLTEEQIKYGGRDAYVVLPLREEIIKTINALELRYPAKIDFDTIDPIASLEITGFPIDPKRWAEVDVEMRKRRLNILDALSDELRKKGVVKQQGLFSGAPLVSKRAKTGIKRNTPTNSVTSPKQVAHYLEAYGITLPKKKDKKTQTSNKTTSTPWLKPLRNNYKIIPLLLEFRELDKRKTSYGAKYTEKYCNLITARIHSDFDPQGAKTARFTDNKPNLQQIPAIEEYRSCFVAPEGWKFVGGDFSQIELRIAAELSGDTGFIEAFLSGEDFHAKTAELMFGVSPNNPKEYKAKRTYAKRINFGIIYGMGAEKLAMQTDLHESKGTLRLVLLEEAGIIEDANKWLQEKLDEGFKKWEALKLGRELSTPEIEKQVAAIDTAQDYLDKYYETFKRLMFWLKARGKETADNAQIRMATGRLVKFWVNQRDRTSRAQAERNGMNTPIQGLAGEVLKIAMRLFFDEITKANLHEHVKLCHTVHDELQTLVRDLYDEENDSLLTDWTAYTLEKCMLEAGQLFLKTVPVKVDLKISQVWEK